MLYLSPTEHDLRRLLLARKISFATSSLCEDNGVDVIVTTLVGLIGFQRKRLADLEASLRDGRFSKELGQIRSSSLLHAACLLCEFDPRRVTRDGGHLDSVLTSRQLSSISIKCQRLGIVWLRSESLADTLEVIQSAARYLASNREEDFVRPKPATDSWGRRTSRDWGIHLLQSFPNIGPRTAAAIYDTLGIPLSWTITSADLLRVPGIGVKTADRLISALRVLSIPNKTP